MTYRGTLVANESASVDKLPLESAFGAGDESMVVGFAFAIVTSIWVRDLASFGVVSSTLRRFRSQHCFFWVRNPSNEVSLKSKTIISLSRIGFIPKK